MQSGRNAFLGIHMCIIVVRFYRPTFAALQSDPSKPKLEDHAILNANRRITKLILQDSYNRTNVVLMLAISSLSYISAS